MSVNPDPSLVPFFTPRGVVVIGASTNPTKLGFGLARNLVQSGYQGAIHFVNPRGGRLLERPVYESVADVPDPVDLAVLLIPAPLVAQTLAEAGERGIRAAIIASGGFREVGPEGAAYEDDCLRVARDYDMRLIGPNCIGVLDTHVPLDTTFLPPPGPTPGGIAFISHSGAICAAVIDWARGQGFGLSRLVSLGNQLDVRETDMLTAVAADPHTRVLTMYLEGISDGRRFVHVASQVSQEKPIIALKVGRFAAGQAAVASHTGALAGQESAFNAAFRRAGVIRADTSEELFDWARTLAWCPLPDGPNVAVLTNAGGPGVTATDALESHGLHLASLSAETQAALATLLPAGASLRNPVDMLAAATAEQYADSLRILLDDPHVDSVMVILPPPPMESAGGVARAMIPIIYSANKPVVVALMGERMIQEAVEYFRAAQIPDYRFPERAAAALAVLVRRAELLRARSIMVDADDAQLDGQSETALHPERVLKLLATLPDADGDELRSLPAEMVEAVATAYGIRTPAARLAASAEEAVTAASEIGYPVALKVVSPAISHKSDAGGVLIGLDSPEAVMAGYETIRRNAHQYDPDAPIDGVLVQQMILGGQEVIVGAVQDPQFGPLVMFGSGGIEVEGLGDVTFALAPVPSEEARQMLRETWAGRRLGGFRHVPAADSEAVLDAIQRLGQLAADFPQIAEIEINPLRVMAPGDGVYAVDLRASVRSS